MKTKTKHLLHSTFSSLTFRFPISFTSYRVGLNTGLKLSRYCDVRLTTLTTIPFTSSVGWFTVEGVAGR